MDTVRPGPNDNVFIDGGKPGSSFVTFNGGLSSLATVNHVTIDTGDTLRMLYNFDVNQTLPVLTSTNGFTINGTLKSSATIFGGTIDAAAGRYLVGANGTFDGSGTVLLSEIGSATNGTVNIGPGLTVIGGLQRGALLVNRGTMISDGPNRGDQMLVGSFTNLGTVIVSNGGVIHFGFGFTQISDLGALVNNGGRFSINSTLDNTGRTFALNNTTGDWQLEGTIRNGTYQSNDDKALYVTNVSTLDNVQVDGTIHVSTTSSALFVPAGQSVHGGGVIAMDSAFARLQSSAGTAALIIEPTMTVRGFSADDAIGGGDVANFGVGRENTPLINRGHIFANEPGKVLRLQGSSYQNTGSFEVGSGAILSFGGSFRRDGLGTVINNGGTLRVGGTLDNTAQPSPSIRQPDRGSSTASSRAAT